MSKDDTQRFKTEEIPKAKNILISLGTFGSCSEHQLLAANTHVEDTSCRTRLKYVEQENLKTAT